MSVSRMTVSLPHSNVSRKEIVFKIKMIISFTYQRCLITWREPYKQRLYLDIIYHILDYKFYNSNSMYLWWLLVSKVSLVQKCTGCPHFCFRHPVRAQLCWTGPSSSLSEMGNTIIVSQGRSWASTPRECDLFADFYSLKSLLRTFGIYLMGFQNKLPSYYW